ncbi:hypothetical protein PGTUg99_025587 [Puccinia graminis f. sp. tritici]|uniref:SET domain-containing protein n=1 Tax=Puccinia graminis f. sp. tritici TaxID=56615 RepID=A0A5B0S1X2_PUCGR|nr:hypothetical protein PGTUg99_025587 [Puccinia graminis f. sp. tritici]
MSGYLLVALACIYAPILLASDGPGPEILAFSSFAVQQDHDHWANSTNLICESSDSPFLPPSSEDLIYKFDQVDLKSTPQPFRDGFFKSTCFVNPIDNDPADFCIFVNPTVNRGQGIVILAPEKEFEQSLAEGLELSDDLPNLDTIEVVDMPEKGGKGAVAARDIQVGEDVALMRPVALVPLGHAVWSTSFGQSVRRQTIDHLPLRTRAEVARLHGEGRNEDQFISNLIDVNTFNSEISKFNPLGAVMVDASRLNHACRPNVVYTLDSRTQTLRMRAFKPIAKGEELTISYRSLEMTGKTRRESLKDDYGFDCTCSHCQMSSDLQEKSDERVLRILELRYKAYSHSDDDRFSAEEVQEFLSLCETENIPSCLVTANLLAAGFYNSEGQYQKVKEHAEAAGKIGILTWGSSWKGLEQVELLLHAPEKHKSHYNRR